MGYKLEKVSRRYGQNLRILLSLAGQNTCLNVIRSIDCILRVENHISIEFFHEIVDFVVLDVHSKPIFCFKIAQKDKIANGS